MSTPFPIPRIVGDYVTIYRPAGDVFPGPDTKELQAGVWYEDWVPNDHVVLPGPDGAWHAFGIAHPITGLGDVHEGEHQSFHARSPQGNLRDVLQDAFWEDLPKILPPAERPGEILANHAPFIVEHGDLYHMFYGPSPIRRATSTDFMTWTPVGPAFFEPGGARDPNLLLWDGVYHLLFCCEDEVRLRTSTDLLAWSNSRKLLQMPDGIAPESPALIRHAGAFYLFVCGWDGVWDKQDVSGAYQHVTYVYGAEAPDGFCREDEITQLQAHAPEVFQDEAGDWFISSAEYPARGISIAPLAWDTA
jgi:hypothetical protein